MPDVKDLTGFCSGRHQWVLSEDFRVAISRALLLFEPAEVREPGVRSTGQPMPNVTGTLVFLDLSLFLGRILAVTVSTPKFEQMSRTPAVS